jgi:ribosomal protein L32
MPQNIKKSSTHVVHHSHVICDHCDTEIKGIRYKASLIYLLFFDKLNFIFEISVVTAVIMIYVRNVRRYHQKFTMNVMYS